MEAAARVLASDPAACAEALAPSRLPAGRDHEALERAETNPVSAMPIHRTISGGRMIRRRPRFWVARLTPNSGRRSKGKSRRWW